MILDTCALLEMCKPAPKISPKTIKLMEKGSYLLSISFAEIACKVKLGKLEINIPIRQFVDEIQQIENLEIIDIGVNAWPDSIELDWPDNKDPADRIITAFAIHKQLPIVTSDNKIKSFYKKVIW